ncbi:MAG TPA: alpha/beta hydrolase [Oligoflexia bacterium]|nr:alpha/beta hydrolase [bacterium]HMQ11369.1 alpha/beta hydrolase [Oligoflexia bacterium]HMR24065.1 alpha/beta hydrolase [Oligoflexia bacterium]
MKNSVKYTSLLLALAVIVFFYSAPKIRNFVHNKNAYRPLFKTSSGNGKKVLFLHGLSGTHAYWVPLKNSLDKSRYHTVALDLLGFGQSPWPDVEYSMDDHINAILSSLDPGEFTIVAHSLGTLIALELKHRYPERFKKLVLLAPLEIKDRDVLKKILKKRNMIESVMALDRFWAPLVCHIHEALGPLSFYMLRPFIPKYLPDNIVEGARLHRWESYNGSLENIVLNKQSSNYLNNDFEGIDIYMGVSDPYSKPLTSTLDQTSYRLLIGGHNFIWENSDNVKFILSHSFGR